MVSIRASIIVLCYNQLESATRPCLESILANTPAGSYELVVVDNASEDGTKEYLQEMANGHEHLQVQCNDTNRGYAGGNNDGMRLANGEYVVLLNNDTLVPKGWLETLLGRFEADPSIGLIGPVTNSAGNEQRIELPGLTERNYEQVAGDYCDQQRGEWFETEKLGFFCVAIRRAVIELVGYLDEQFVVGMFEDDDYCFRVKHADYRLVVVEDCFIYHKGSLSFNQLEKEEYLNIFKRNEAFFFKKHGVLWTYADIARAIWKKILRDFLKESESSKTLAADRVEARMRSMTDALIQLRKVEERSATIEGQSYLEVQLAEKQRELMAMSDWASGVNREYEKALEEVALGEKRLEEKHQELMIMSDWGDGLSKEFDQISKSRLYRMFRYLQKRGM